MKDTQFKAGLVQFDIRRGETSANRKTVADYLHRLGTEGVRLAVLPEMWSCGFDNEHLAVHGEQTPEILEELSDIARQFRMVIAGSLPETTPEGVYNTLHVIDADGTIAGSYRKVHLFSVTGEEKFFLGGRENVVCDTAAGRLGLMICYDLRFPELCRAVTLKGADIVVVPAQWPRVRISRWDILLQARAMENQVYVIGVNRCGRENRTVFSGHSAVVDPSGEVLHRVVDESAARTVMIDMDHIETVRTYMPSLKERVPEAYGI